MNGLTPYAMIPQPYWNPSVGQISYVQQPPVAYYQPYDYQAIQPQYPLVLASPPTPVSKTPTNKPSGPLPFAPLGRTRQESNIVYTSLGIAPQPIVPPLIPQAVIPAPIPQVIIPAPIPPPIIPRILLPPQPIYYHRHSSLSPYYHHDRSSLPPISEREKHHERNQDRHSHDDRLIMSYFGRRHNVDRHRYPDRWYY